MADDILTDDDFMRAAIGLAHTNGWVQERPKCELSEVERAAVEWREAEKDFETSLDKSEKGAPFHRLILSLAALRAAVDHMTEGEK